MLALGGTTTICYNLNVCQASNSVQWARLRVMPPTTFSSLMASCNEIIWSHWKDLHTIYWCNIWKILHATNLPWLPSIKIANMDKILKIGVHIHLVATTFSVYEKLKSGKSHIQSWLFFHNYKKEKGNLNHITIKNMYNQDLHQMVIHENEIAFIHGLRSKWITTPPCDGREELTWALAARRKFVQLTCSSV